jgi:hypothetical protein
MVWDYDGRYRLNRTATLRILAIYRDQVVQHFQFDEEQTKQAKRNYNSAVKQYDWVLSENASDIEEFKLGRQRMLKLDSEPTEKQLRDGVDSLGGQRETIRREWMGKVSGPLKQIDEIWDNYQKEQNAIATPGQRNSNGDLAIGKPRTNHIDTSIIDGLLPYFDIAVGLMLLLGLFTPIAGLAAGVFLFSVFLSQYPPATGTTSSNYQLIESMACFAVASTGAGRFAGLDYFLHLWIRKNKSDQFYEQLDE